MNSNLVRKTVCLLVILAIILTTFAVIPIGIAEKVGTYEIEGMVMYKKTDNTDAVVQGATVILYNLHTGEKLENTTDKYGHFIFKSVKPGHYQTIAKPPNINYLTIEGINGS